MPLTFDLPIEELRAYQGKNPRPLGYIDIQFLASRIKAEMDTICPPSAQFAAYNKLVSMKKMVIYPGFRHEPLPGWLDQAFQFLMGV